MSFADPSVTWNCLAASPLAAGDDVFNYTDDDPCCLPDSLLTLGFLNSLEALPSIDEAVFDLIGSDVLPDLEEVDCVPMNSEPSAAPISCISEVPALEEVIDGSLLSLSVGSQLSPTVSWNSVRESPQVMTPVMFEEEISLDGGDTLPEMDASCNVISTLPLYDDSKHAEKRRRVSQISVASFCSTFSESSSSSPLSTLGDSDLDQKPHRGGRKSRFTLEDRKERKKAQNRTAAERYRQKRRLIEETVSEEEQALMNANGDLKIEVTKLEAEVSCLKRLMREMLETKGFKFQKKNI